MSITVISQISRDYFATSGEECIGGPVAYAGQFLATAPVIGELVVKGANTEIQELKKNLQDSIKIRAIITKDTTTFITTEKNGTRVQEVSTKCPSFTCQDIEGLTADYVHISPIIGDISTKIIVALRQRCKILSYDPLNNDDGILEPTIREEVLYNLRFADIVKLSSSEATALFGELDPGRACRLLSRHVPLAIVTMGEKGAYFCQNDVLFSVPSSPVCVVDSCGCGDVLSVAFLVALAEGKPLREAAAFAVRAASLKARGRGIASVPRYGEVMANG